MKPVKAAKLNALQSKTLAILQQLAKHSDSSTSIEDSMDIRITHLPHAHGSHVHVGDFVVSAKDVSGLDNPSVWMALVRKGIVRDGWETDIVLTEAGIGHITGLEDKFMSHSDH